ncbi:FAD-binding protein [Streptomyces sp. TRM72054]|uniref:FAD-binding oxidoreductase n=1 Tax=Streptomyces sp. TRM72054 TaxID=2870562 RepID=UPI001C8C1B96|nr:FAD-binding protein [Streptomyces sp. TRM72054]MBX9397129.1 FAD-binding protein [Streptomyces sp. TRM72054]
MGELKRRRFVGLGSGLAFTAAAAAGGGLATAPYARAEDGIAAGTGRAAAPKVEVTPTDSRYADLTSGNNLRWKASPDKIVLPRTTGDVIAAVREAVAGGKRLSVCGGGHCFEDFVFNADIRININMSLMNAVTFDTAMNAFRVEGGATLLDVYEALYEGWGVTIPAGICHSVGVGGHVTGGGYGNLSRQYGLTVDHLHAVEVVVVDAAGTVKSVVAARDSADAALRDLFWAHTGGGGGSFGVVTAFWFRTPGATGDPANLLPKAPSKIFLTLAGWPWEKVTQEGFARLVDYWGTWFEKNNTPGTTAGSLYSWLMLNHRDSGSLGAVVQLDASLPDAAGVLSDFLAGMDQALGLSSATTRHDGVLDSQYTSTRLMPWLRGTKYIGAISPTQLDPTTRGSHKSAHLRGPMPRRQIDAMYTHLTSTDKPSTLTGIVLSASGGRIASVSSTATAVAQRDAIMKVNFESRWYNAADDARNTGWVRKAFSAVYADTGGVPVPNDVTDGCYINYPDGDLADPAYNTSSVPWHDLYWKQNYKRLQQVKRTWDPGNVFRHKQSVRLP